MLEDVVNDPPQVHGELQIVAADDDPIDLQSGLGETPPLVEVPGFGVVSLQSQVDRVDVVVVLVKRLRSNGQTFFQKFDVSGFLVWKTFANRYMPTVRVVPSGLHFLCSRSALTM